MIHKQQALHEHGVAAITCLLSGLRVFRSDFPEQSRLLRVGKGLHGLHVYATEYWTEYVLSYATRANEFDTDSPSPLISLACQLTDEVEDSGLATPTEQDTEPYQLDERLSSLLKYPKLHQCVCRALKARSLENLQTRMLEGHGE